MIDYQQYLDRKASTYKIQIMFSNNRETAFDLTTKASIGELLGDFSNAYKHDSVIVFNNLAIPARCVESIVINYKE